MYLQICKLKVMLGRQISIGAIAYVGKFPRLLGFA